MQKFKVSTEVNTLLKIDHNNLRVRAIFLWISYQANIRLTLVDKKWNSLDKSFMYVMFHVMYRIPCIDI